MTASRRSSSETWRAPSSYMAAGSCQSSRKNSVGWLPFHTRADPIFHTRSGRARDKDNVRNRVLGPCVEDASARRQADGHPPLGRVTPHTLRRTFISLLLANGAELSYVMSQVGHTDEGTTLRIYAKVLRRDRRHVGEAVDEMVARAFLSAAARGTKRSAPSRYPDQAKGAEKPDLSAAATSSPKACRPDASVALPMVSVEFAGWNTSVSLPGLPDSEPKGTTSSIST
jgi:hypothetical protein